jgi:hypothetical protein
MRPERVTDPALIPVKLTVYTPLPALVVDPKDPEPGVAVLLNVTAPTPEGFGLPKLSRAVSVVVIVDPEATVGLETPKVESAKEKAAGEMLIKLEQSVVKLPELALK